MIIKLDNIEKSIKGNQVLNQVSFEFESGKIYGIYGRNGSGKTMLMRMILGLIHSDHGSVTIDGKIIGKDIDFPESVGAMIENPGFFPYATGYENLKMLADIKGKIDENDIREAIQKVGLDDQEKRVVAKYSMGMKQRLAIAQAIMEKPDLLVLDEPTNALDQEGVDVFRKIIQSEAKRGTLIIISSHNKEDIDILSDIKIRMESGKIVDYADNSQREVS
ncbi:ABC-2 type transport system ATP-binding protein [Kandleria vitulina]|uniref:ABC-2 type transport system ATP-binding protein n=1 Tax=Kandleria vitulina TaxID=1630 RepID=A0A1H2T640_9FIRM|nr:ATP-binding cassette domain-containing protein [Kandleria vitulina]SDW39423.1 ABC-2 type transport system ATP-binding protein [Kandleria vitulina]